LFDGGVIKENDFGGCEPYHFEERWLRLFIASPAQNPCTKLHRAFHFYPASIEQKIFIELLPHYHFLKPNFLVAFQLSTHNNPACSPEQSEPDSQQVTNKDIINF